MKGAGHDLGGNKSIPEAYVRLQATEVHLANVRKTAISFSQFSPELGKLANEITPILKEIRQARVDLMQQFGVEETLQPLFREDFGTRP